MCDVIKQTGKKDALVLQIVSSLRSQMNMVKVEPRERIVECQKKKIINGRAVGPTRFARTIVQASRPVAWPIR